MMQPQPESRRTAHAPDARVTLSKPRRWPASTGRRACRNPTRRTRPRWAVVAWVLGGLTVHLPSASADIVPSFRLDLAVEGASVRLMLRCMYSYPAGCFTCPWGSIARTAEDGTRVMVTNTAEMSPSAGDECGDKLERVDPCVPPGVWTYEFATSVGFRECIEQATVTEACDAGSDDGGTIETCDAGCDGGGDDELRALGGGCECSGPRSGIPAARIAVPALMFILAGLALRADRRRRDRSTAGVRPCDDRRRPPHDTTKASSAGPQAPGAVPVIGGAAFPS